MQKSAFLHKYQLLFRIRILTLLCESNMVDFLFAIYNTYALVSYLMISHNNKKVNIALLLLCVNEQAEMDYYIKISKLTRYFLSVNAELFFPSACDRKKKFGGNKTWGL